MPGYWPFYIYLFIYFHFFLAIKKSRLIKTHAPKKERGQYPISTPVLTQSERGRALGSRPGPISSHLDRKSLIYHMAKNRTLYCPRVLLWTMTCNHWKVFSEWHGFKGWHGFVPVSKLGLVKCQTLARRRQRWRTISSDCTWPALVKMEKRNCFT